MVKMSDVAKLAKVSPATVSRVLSGTSYISEKTRSRVLDAINKLDYKPNRLAGNLRKMSSKMIMGVLPDITNPYYARIVQGLQHVAREQGYYILLGDTENDIEHEQKYLDLAKERMVDGLILMTARIAKEDILSISNLVPVVLACEYLDGHDIPSISIDNVSAAREATSHLLKLGHSKIGFISSPESVIKRDRFQGYQEALHSRGITIDPKLIYDGDFGIESGYTAARKVLALNDVPTAICASGDQMAVGAIKAIQDHGLRVPEDIAVVGFGNISLCTVVKPELTTIAQPTYEMGVMAIKMLFDLLAGKELKQRHVVLPHELIIRQSCGANRLV